jgi:hypothetical protein
MYTTCDIVVLNVKKRLRVPIHVLFILETSLVPCIEGVRTMICIYMLVSNYSVTIHTRTYVFNRERTLIM